MKFNYEHLDVAKIAKELIAEVYKLTRSFPNEERFGLTSQIRRAVVSILLNIAEGSIRKTKKDFARFVRISLGSLTELNAALEVSVELGFLEDNEYMALRKKLEALFFKLIGLEKYLRE